MLRDRLILLDGARAENVRRCLGDRVDARALAEGRNPVVTITRAGEFFDPRYGEFAITREMLSSMVRNFEAGVYGQRIVLNIAHNDAEGAAGWFNRLFLDGNKLRGEVELTDLGREAISRRGYRYLSAELVENYRTNEEPRTEHGPTLLGAALTVRPVIKRLDPVELAEDTGVPTYVTERVTRFLTEEINRMDKLRKKLQEQLQALGLSQAAIDGLLSAYDGAAKMLGEDEKAGETLVEQLTASGKALAEQVGDRPVSLSVQMPQAAPADLDALVSKKLAEAQAAAAEQARKLAETKESLVKTFHETLGDLEGLSDEEKKTFSEAADLITPEMTAEQVKRLAAQQKALAGQMAAARKLTGLGYEGPRGSVHISLDERNSVMELQEHILGNLRRSSPAGNGRIKLAEKETPFAEKVLAEFDRLNARRLSEERKIMLAGGTTGMADSDLPVGFQRTVIREALGDLRILDLVQAMTDFQATATTQIPYEERDVAAVLNDGVVAEGNPIHRASIAQKMDIAYIQAMKIAWLVSNEVMHFSRTSGINWDAWARNVESNSRYMRELVQRRIANTLQREADAFLTATNTQEGFDGQLDGATVSTIKTTNFPIVRPFQQKDLQGSNIGAVRNPITVRLDGTAIGEYDGSGTQAAGTYYRVTNYNLGYVQFVDETGAAVTPPNAAGADDITYDHSTNVVKFDMDLPASTAKEKHMNGLLQAIGARKALLSQERFVMPDFLLLSATLHNDATDAETFQADSRRRGTDDDAQGDLEMVKAIPAWSTNAPGIDLGEERILIGQRGNAGYVIAKPFMAGEPFEEVNSAGVPVGRKQAYGEEYNAIHVPIPMRGRMTSVLAYSFTGR